MDKKKRKVVKAVGKVDTGAGLVRPRTRQAIWLYMDIGLCVGLYSVSLR